jgi:hypothetical protein
MRMDELVKSATAANERAFKRTDEKTAVAIARALMAELANKIDETEDRLSVVGLGHFLVKEVEAPAERGGGKVKRIMFRRSRTKA